MIAGWSPLQLPLGTDCPGKGTFTPAPPPTPSRFLSREHSLFPCGSYCDRGGSDSFSFPDLKASLVGNLIGALINATEILDEYADCPDQSHVFEQLLELEASHKERDLVLSSDSLAHSESLGLVPLERLSDGDHNDSAVSPSFHQIVAMPYWSQRHAHTDNTVRPSTVLNVDGLSKGQRKLSVDTTKRSAKDEHGTAHNSISEEDLLLQQARSKAHRSKAEIGVVINNSSQAGASAVRSRDGSVRGPQHLAANVGVCMAEKAGGCSEAGDAWFLHGGTTLSLQNTLFWGAIALGMLLTGALLVTCCSNLFQGRHRHRPSLKRRILKSQWYGNSRILASNPSSLASLKDWRFQMKISEVPKFSTLEVDGDKKSLRFPSESVVSALHARKEIEPTLKAPTSTLTSAQGSSVSQVSKMKKVQGQPIRQTVQNSEMLPKKQDGPRKVQATKIWNGAATKPSPDYVRGPRGALEVEKPKVSGFQGRKVQNTVLNDSSHQRFARTNDQRQWRKEDELDLDRRIQNLYQTIQAVEQHRRTAMLALEEEKQRSFALEKEMLKQRDAATMLGEEVRLLKESHHALLASLQKKYSTTAAARTAADLVYQDWERHVAAE